MNNYKSFYLKALHTSLMGITLEMGAVNGLKNDILGFSRVISTVNQRYVFSFY